MKFILGFLTFFCLSVSYAQETVVLSTIYSKQIESKYLKLSVLADYLEKNNKNNLKFKVKLFKSADDVIKAINSEQVHIFIDSLYATKLIEKNTDTSIACKSWKNGSEGYRSVIFVKENSSIETLQDLKDKTIAFEDKYSTSSYFIPKKVMEKEGLELSSIKIKSKTNYIFAFSEENIAAKVFFSQVDAGTLDDKSFSEINNGQFKVIYKSELLPRSIVSFSNVLSLENKKEIKRVMFDMENSKKGKTVLNDFEKSKRFSSLSKDEMVFIRSL